MSAIGLPIRVAVVIATCNRRGLLSDRAVPSVVAQTRPPDFLVIVDDSCSEARPSNARFVAGLALPRCAVAYLENACTAGASGSWNTALDFLTAETGDAGELFVALLDDDDSWHPDYLASCHAAASAQRLDMVACGIRRIEDETVAPVVSDAPESLRANEFLTGNPGIQGSNLFVRLSVILAAGGFDEALRSTTDRDLCIRIAELGTVRYGRLPGALVDHFADPDRSRLSARGSAAKLEGLTAFWRKYVGRMTVDQRQAFLDRASTLFGWSLPSDNIVVLPRDDAPMKTLVLGLFADNGRPTELLGALRELADWRDDTLLGLDVVLIERGCQHCGPSVIDDATALLRDLGAGCFTFSLEDQNDAVGKLLLSSLAQGPGKTAAERDRELLRSCCARASGSRDGTEIWLAEGAERNGGTPSGTQEKDILRRLGAAPSDNGQLASLDVDPDTVGALDRWAQRERVATAEHRLRRRFSLTGMRLLGCGSEAVVFTDERTVYKCIDYWKTRIPQSQLDFLQGQVGRWTDAAGLYPLHTVEENGRWAVLTYDYEPSRPYDGGLEADLIRLLQSCSDVGIVCNNVHPKNLIVTGAGVKLIDYGSDIRPWTPLGFEHMARRAFLSSRYAAHPDLQSLMRRALTDDRLSEMAGYSSFRAQAYRTSSLQFIRDGAAPGAGAPPIPGPVCLYVGIITSDPATLRPLLDGLTRVHASGRIDRLAVVVLDNGSPSDELDAVVSGAREGGLELAIVNEARQRLDAAKGAFGRALSERPEGQVGIAHARTMVQRYLGALLVDDPGSFGWVLDDDVRLDARTSTYLAWLPAFRERGTDVLITACRGSSPNPPLHGLRVQLVDLVHNIQWLRNLPSDSALPDRSTENRALQERYPDYYYDLSRKHTAHLEIPHWLEPAFEGESVREAYSRLLDSALGLLSGVPLTRPVVATPPSDPLGSAIDSVNRGGSTFVLNHRALSETPNTIMRVNGREARRSDMIWAIVNRYYRRMTIHAVPFPLHHVGRVTAAPSINIEKVRGELVGSSLYAALSEFLQARPHHTLDFSREESLEVLRLAKQNRFRRWRMLEQSCRRIIGLAEALRALARPGELQELLEHLSRWFTPATLADIRVVVETDDDTEIHEFLASLRSVADDFAIARADVGFIRSQLRDCGVRTSTDEFAGDTPSAATSGGAQ